MSISTSSLGSYSCPAYSSGMSLKASPRSQKTLTVAINPRDCRQDSALVLDGWKNELAYRVNISEDTVDEFLTVFVPSASDPPNIAIRPGLFSGWTPTKGKEDLMYPFLVRSDLCSFPTCELTSCSSMRTSISQTTSPPTDA